MRTVSVYTPLSLVVAVTSGPGTRPSLIGIGDARTRTPATAAPVVISVARPVIFRGTGVGLGAAVVASVALGVTVGVETEIVGSATVGVGSRVRCSVAAGEQAVATTLSASSRAMRRMTEPYADGQRARRTSFPSCFPILSRESAIGLYLIPLPRARPAS